MKTSAKQNDLNNGESNNNAIKNENGGGGGGGGAKGMPRSTKPTSSLDRRRTLTRNRHERDSKSRSAHSLQESSATSTTDYAAPEQSAKGERDFLLNCFFFFFVRNFPF